MTPTGRTNFQTSSFHQSIEQKKCRELDKFAYEGKIDAVKKYVKEGCKINHSFSPGPLYFALCKNNWNVADYLMKQKSINVNKTYKQRTILSYLSEKGSEEGVSYLLKENADPNGNYPHSPLHYAAGNGYHKIAQLLLENNASVNASYKKWNIRKSITPLFLAVNKNHPDTVSVLLRYGANKKGIKKYIPEEAGQDMRKQFE